uniref:Putative ovule protein n=1 Tax=Solanum chacoense TaxID=4108 RepID=A0A0V0HFI4_SOLCH
MLNQPITSMSFLGSSKQCYSLCKFCFYLCSYYLTIDSCVSIQLLVPCHPSAVNYGTPNCCKYFFIELPLMLPLDPF